MSSLADEYKLSQYKELEPLDNKGNVYIVRDTRDNKIWVKKKISKAGFDAYSKIKGIKNGNIVYIRDIIGTDNHLYVIEEYIDGITLQRFLNEKGKLPPKEVRDIMCQICDGLNILHGKKIIHRDIAPSNIIISNDGKVKIIDMGISRIKKDNINQDTTILGTAGYAAPEQFGFNQTNETADIYSCGVLMNVMLTGKFPFEEKYTGLMDYIIDRCLNMEAKSRYQTAADLKLALINSGNKSAKYIEIINKLPGFRSNNTVYKFIATIDYAIFVFIFAISFINFIIAIRGMLPYADSLIFILMDIFTVLMPLLIVGNYLNYQEKLPIVKDWDKIYRTILGIVVAFIEFTLSLSIVLMWSNT